MKKLIFLLCFLAFSLTAFASINTDPEVEKPAVELTVEKPASEAQLAQLNILLTPTLLNKANVEALVMSNALTLKTIAKFGGKLTSKCTSTDPSTGATYDIMYGDGTGIIYLRAYETNGTVTLDQIDIITAMRICALGNK